MNQLAHAIRTDTLPAVTSTLSGMIAGMLPSRDNASLEVALKTAATGKLYKCTVPLSLARQANLTVGAIVEIIGIEAAPQYLRAVGLAVFR